jgi:replicative DNA helicase
MPSGITPGQFGLFLAYPAIGKSWLMLYFAVQAWKHGKKPLVISLEMTEAEVRNRAYTIMGEGLWSHKHLSQGDVDIDDFKMWARKHLEGNPPFQIVSSDGSGEVTPAILRGKIDQYKPDIVFVDYIQLMSANKATDSETVKIKSISRDLKLLAIGEQVPIVAISSATPDDVNDMSAPPTLGQVSWAKQQAYDADWVLALGRGENSNVIEAVFRKNRNGYLGDFLIEVDFNQGRFRYKDFEEI